MKWDDMEVRIVLEKRYSIADLTARDMRTLRQGLLRLRSSIYPRAAEMSKLISDALRSANTSEMLNVDIEKEEEDEEEDDL